MAKPKFNFLVGIDEAGRGPLAGPVSVGVVIMKWPANSVKKSSVTQTKRSAHPLFEIAADSKKLSADKREEIFKKIRAAKKEGTLDYAVSLSSADMIDKKGIVFAIRHALSKSLKKIGALPHQTLVLLDGSLSAPEEFIFQETIIRGDQSEPIIGLASIAAKVTRDQKMIQLSKQYPDYDFHIHKGYGTLAHRQKIKKFGPSEIHRKSFLSGFL